MVSAGHIPGISDDICFALQQIFSRFVHIDTVLLFGSRAKGSYKNGSDIDLAVCAPALSESAFTDLWNQIDALPIIFKIDLLHWDRLANQALKEKIITEGQVFYRGKRA